VTESDLCDPAELVRTAAPLPVPQPYPAGDDDPNDVRTSLATTGQGCLAFAALTRPKTDAGLEGRMLLREISRAGAIRDLGDLALEGPLTNLRFRREVGVDGAGNMIVFGSFAKELALAPPLQPPLSTGTADVDDTDLFLAKLAPSP
jgi:hypothetical protein